MVSLLLGFYSQKNKKRKKKEFKQVSRLKAGIIQLSEWSWSLGQKSRNHVKYEFEVATSNCSAVSIKGEMKSQDCDVEV